MAENDKSIVFVNLLREETNADESVIGLSLRSVERWISQSSMYEFVNTAVSKVTGREKVPQGNAVLHEDVDALWHSLKPGQCGVIAHGNSYSIMDHRQHVDAAHSKLTALGVENILKAAGCTESMPVILYSCNTGVGESSLAAELSQFHPVVVAPDGVIAKFITASKPGIFKGDESSGTIDDQSPRQWNVFSHGRKISSYDWGEELSAKPFMLER